MSKGFLLQEKFFEVCQAHPQRVAFVEIKDAKTHEFTCSQIHKLAKNIGAWLINSGIQQQDRIAIILDNSLQWSATYFGILSSGATAVPLDVKLTEFEISNLLTDSEAKIVFTTEKLVGFFKKNLQNLTHLKKVVLIDTFGPALGGALSVDTEQRQIRRFYCERVDNENCNLPFVAFEEVILESKPEVNFPKGSYEDIASIIYTSGTVGKPKGVMLTHKNFSANFQSLEKLNICSHRDCFISILPLHHAFAFIATLIFPLFLRAKIAYPKSLKSEDILECIRKNSVTFFVGVPEIFNAIHKSIFEKIKEQFFLKRLILNLSLDLFWSIRRITKLNLAKILLKPIHLKFGVGLRYLVSGGAKLNPVVARDFFKLGFTILEGYGLTETAPVVSLNTSLGNKIGSVGRPIDGISVKMGENNEILIQGDNVMKGYFRNPEQTHEVIKDGWFYSGDAGYIDNDGYIFITGRLKEIIVLSSGKNIYPEEIEDYFKKSEFIKEICLLSFKNTQGNEVLAAVVVPDFEHFKQVGDANINRKIKWELENFSSQLPTYKRITDFLIIKEELPKTRLGKLKRYEVESKYLSKFGNKREVVEESYSPSLEDISILNSEIAKKLINFLSKKLSLKREIRLDDHLELDLGLDSLAKVELAMGLQNMLKVEIPDSLMGKIFTVRELILKLSDFLFLAETTSKVSQSIVSWKDLLNLPPPKELIEKIELHPRFFNKLLSFLMPKILFIIFKLFWQLKVEGRENLPQEGTYVFCSNHASYLDGFILGCSVPFKIITNLYFLGDKNIFEHSFIRWSLKIARLVPIDPTKELVNTLQVSSYILRHNKMLCIFPEGMRSFEGKPAEFKKGIGILVKELELTSKINIIPVAIIGSFQAWPRTRSFPRLHPIKIVFGKALDAEMLLSAGKEAGIADDYQAIAFAIKKEVENLFYSVRL